jgi:catechol 2,3-dioxygenase-like lactoylglutathione lyase family enzyme
MSTETAGRAVVEREQRDSGYRHSGYRQGRHHIALTIPPGAEPRVRAFYAGVLGMTEVDDASSAGRDGGCHFRSGDLAFDFDVDLSAHVPAPRNAHPGSVVADIDALAARLAQEGVAVEWDDKFLGYRRFYARDPLGNRLEFLQQLPVG